MFEARARHSQRTASASGVSAGRLGVPRLCKRLSIGNGSSDRDDIDEIKIRVSRQRSFEFRTWGGKRKGAKHINRALSKELGRRRTGQVFADRYHAKQLTSPTQVRHGLCYVRNNWRRHGEDKKLPGRPYDPLSSGEYSDGWDDEAQTYRMREDDELLPICQPQSWLLSVGWKKAGLLSPWEVPGPET